MALWHLTETGTLAESLGGEGWLTHHDLAGGGQFDSGHAVTWLEGGYLAVAGFSNNGTSDDLALWCFAPDGTLVDSKVLDNAAGGSGHDEGWALVLDGAGRLIVVGTSFNGTSQDMAVWRFLLTRP